MGSCFFSSYILEGCYLTRTFFSPLSIPITVIFVSVIFFVLSDRQRVLKYAISLSFLFIFDISYCYADIYMFMDDDGVLHFTDSPRHEGYIKIVKSSAASSNKSDSSVISEGRGDITMNEIDSLIKNFSKESGIDPALVKAVITVESDFDVNAVSKKGAIGLMQLMPKTAEKFQVKDSFDPEQNIRGGVRYLKNLLDLYKGNIDYSLAAYNAGEKAVYYHKGIPPFTETQRYVKKVKLYYNLLKKDDVKPLEIQSTR